MRRRHLRAIGRSWDKTRKPSGSIQNPRTGKKPKTPPKMSSAPVAMRAMRERGIGTRSEPRTSLPSLWSIPKRFSPAFFGPFFLLVIHKRWAQAPRIQADFIFLKKLLGKSGKHLYYPAHAAAKR
jgi:hypothetical protein